MGRGARAGLIGAGIGVAVLGGLGAAAWLALPGLVAREATARLAALGFAEASIHDVVIGARQATIGALWLDAGGASRLGPITITYSAAGLAEGRADTIVLADGALAIGLGDNVTIAGVAPPEGGGASFALPAARIEATRLRLTLTSAAGEAEVMLTDVAVVPAGDVIGADGSFAVTARAPVTADLGGTFAAALADTASVGIDIERGRIAAADALAEGIAGWLVGALGPDGPEIAGEVEAARVTAAGIEFDAPDLVIDGRPSALTLVARGSGRAGAALRLDALVDLGAREGPVSLALDVPDLRGAGAPADGRFALALDGRVTLDAAGAPSFAGRATADLAAGALAGMTEETRARVDLDVRASTTEARLATRAPATAEGRWTGPVPEALRPLTDGTVALTVEGAVTATRSADGFALSGRGGAILETADGQRGSLDIGEAAAVLDERFGLRAIEQLGFRAAAPAIDLGFARLDDAVAEGEIAGMPGAWTGKIALDAAGALDMANPPVRIAAVGVTARARFTVEGTALGFAPTDCLSIDTDEVRIGPAIVHPTNRICVLSIPEAAFLTVDPGHGVAFGLRVLPFLAEVAPAEPGAFPTLALTAPRLRARVALGPGGAPEMAWINLVGGSIGAPAYQAEASLVEGTIEGGGGAPWTFKLRGDVKHTATPPLVVPLGVTLAGSAAPDAIAATGTLRGASGALALDITARHDPALGAGFAEVRLHPLVFAAGVRAPAQVFPALAGEVEDAAGSVEAKARLAWTAAAPPDGRAEIALRGVDVTAAGVSARAVNGVIALDGLNPPSLPPGQTLAIGLLDVGVPLVNGTVVFGLSRERVLAVERATWDWAGGTIFAEPFEADLDEDAWRATLAARGLDLAQILAIAEVDGLAGTGTLDGRLPLRLGFATVAVEDGLLAATGPGTLRYAPAPGADVLDTGQAGTDLLLDALANFNYDELTMRIDGAAGGETAIGLRLVGRNPDLYDGYPVALNVNLSGALDTLLRRGLAGYRIPEAVRERLEGFGGEGP